ncbi:MAG: Rpn family recombination-promoting nuclease/putative transposase, partial [Planctomycetaceae bacterium]|nr:Rpn family recombination-promoting nuclease/putative transposase [Planctomycetaceae bacterium]
MRIDLSKYIKSLFDKLPRYYRHDAFCKDVFLNLFMARLILTCILDKVLLAELDITRMEIVNDKFINKRLRSLYADVIYRIPLKNGKEGECIYWVIDFKSDNRHNATIQLFRYSYNMSMMLAGIEKDDDDEIKQQTKVHKNQPLPCVIAMIFHCGECVFTAPTDIADLISLPQGSALRSLIFRYRILVYDLNVLIEKTMPSNPIVYLFFRILIIAHSKNVNEEVFALFEKFKEDFYKSKIFLTLWDLGLYYLLTSSKYFDPKTYEKIINLTKELGVKIMSTTIAVKFYQEAETNGIAKGRIEGIKEGKKEGKK